MNIDVQPNIKRLKSLSINAKKNKNRAGLPWESCCMQAHRHWRAEGRGNCHPIIHRDCV